MLTCTACRQQYVGQTKRELKVRIAEHLYDIRRKNDTPVAHHFNQANHSSDNLRCEILEALKGNPETIEEETIRKTREIHWIHQLQTKHPNGMNMRD